MLPCNFNVFSLRNTLFRVFCFILFHFYTLFHDTSVLPQVMLLRCTLSYTASCRVWKDRVDHFIFKT